MSRRRPEPLQRASASQARRTAQPPRVSASLVAVTVAALALAAATVLTFRPVLDHGFLNWDDPDVVAANPRLQQPLGALVPWAFATREMGHYQPLSWLTLAAVAGTPPSSARVHTAALALHVTNALLLLWLVAWWLDRGDGDSTRWAVAAATAGLFALHPLRVEPVAWASALPYVLSYALVLGSVAAWTAWTRGGRRVLLALSVGLFALSQLARVTAPLLAVVLAATATLDPRARRRSLAETARALVPFAVIGVGLALVEASAREVESVADFGLGHRLAWALTHPALYLWRTMAPLDLTTLDALPRQTQTDWARTAAAVAASAAVFAVTWRVWSRRAALAVWGSYLALLAPVLGLFPSGLQVTADRYTYGPALVLCAALAAALSGSRRSVTRSGTMAVGIAAVVLALSAHAQTAHWRDSIALWSRAIALDADNDVARYNLALALVEAGRPAEAEPHLELLLAQVPDHALARAQLSGMRADRAQRAADAAATAGRLREAVTGYTEVLAHDPARTRARLNRGMALVQLGEPARAVADLEAGGARAATDPAVAGALALAWSESGRAADAVGLLRRMRDRDPNNPAVAMNLARLLLTAPPGEGRDPIAALEIAAAVNDATGGRDPIVLATLAEALAATGRRSDAAEAWNVAIAVANESGNAQLAASLRRQRAGSSR
jgi:tetratricopeptide (TPR) repeat protein